jgi:acetyl esterase/lipase
MRDTGGPAAAAVMLIAPWLDVGMANPGIPDIEAHDPMLKAEDLRHYGEQYAGGHDLDEPGISPLHGDPRGLPPMLIHVGTHDILYPDAEAYAAKASAAGADVTLEIWPRMMHVWHAAPMLPEARKAIRSIRAWVDRVAP